MILELFTKPVTTTKKLVGLINKGWLIGISIGIPLILALLPALMAMLTVKSFLNSIPIFGELINLGGNVDSAIFTSVFKEALLWILVITALIYLILLVLFNAKKVNNSPLFIWKSMVISSIQIIFFLIASTVLSFLSSYFILISLLGIINFIICLYSTLAEAIVFGGEILSVNNSQVPTFAAQTNPLGNIAPIVPNINQPQNNNVVNQGAVGSGYSAPAPQKMKSVSPKIIILISSIAAVILLCVVLFFVGNTLTGKESVSKKLAQAIKDNNSKVMAQYIVSSDSRLKINQDTLSGYLAYLKDNPAYTAQLLASIDAQGKANDDIKAVNSLLGSDNVIKLTTNGKNFLIFDNYVYQLPAYFIKLQTDYKNTEVSINNKVLYTASTDNFTKECGPFLPGKYSIQGKLKTDYVEVKGSGDVVLDPTNTASNVLSAKLNLDGQKLSIYSDYKDAKIIINGKDTNITVDKVDTLVPLPNDGSCKIQLQNEFPWGIMKTQEVVFGKDDFDFQFGSKNSEFLNTLSPSIAEFVKSYVAAYTTLDSSKFTNVTEQYKKSADSDINFKKSYGKAFTGNVTSATADLSSLSLTHYSDSDDYKAYVTVALNGDLADEGQVCFDKVSETIDLVYDATQKKWLIDYMGSSWLSSEIKNGVDIKLN